MTSPIALAAPVVEDDAHRSCTRPPQIVMGKIENALIVCVAVNGAHETVRDAEFIV